MKKKILISGGAGFIGSHLTDFLIAEGNEVVVVDNLLSANSYRHPKAKYIIKNVEDFSSRDIFDRACHLASPASPQIYQKYPWETISANTEGLKKIISLAKRTLFASTSEIYGSPFEHPQKEIYWGNVNSFGPRSCYDEAKRLGETICFLSVHHDKKDVRVVRIFNTYGPRMDPADGRVIINFIEQIKKNKPLTIYGSGRQTRCFCYVSDLVKGLVLAMEKGKKGEVYNLGNPEEVTINKMAKILLDLSGKKNYKIKYLKLPQDDPPKRRPDITKANQELGWQPKIGLTEGLKKCLFDDNGLG